MKCRTYRVSFFAMRVLRLLYERGACPSNVILHALWPHRPQAFSTLSYQLQRLVLHGLIQLRCVPSVRKVMTAKQPTKTPPRKFYRLSPKGYEIYEYHRQRAAEAGLPYPVGTTRTCC